MSDISGISNSNRIRITGLASGMDTEDTIKKLMAGENVKVDKMKQNRQLLQWRQEAYRDVIKELRDMRSNYFLFSSPSDTNLIKSQYYTGASIKSTDETTVTATALPGAANGVSSIVVQQIAKPAKTSGNKLFKKQVSIPSGANFKPEDWNDKTIKFTVNGIECATAPIKGVTSENNLAEKINDAISVDAKLAGLSVSFDNTNNKIQFNGSNITSMSSNISLINPTSSTKLSELGITMKKPDPSDSSKDNMGSFVISLGSSQTATVNIKSDMTVDQFINQIYNTKIDGTTDQNLYSKIKVTFSELTGSLSIETRDTGSDKTLSIKDNDLGLSNLGLSNTTVNGQNAKFNIIPPGGSEVKDIERSSNNFTIDNVTYNILKPSAEKDGKLVETTLTTAPDAQKSVDRIKGFVEKYNAMIKKITDKLSEKKNLSYKPLTDAQKKDMKEDQIKAWEEKAKAGLLKNEGDIESIVSKLRESFMTPLSGVGLSLKDIGIETYGSFEAITKPGQLKIDEAKLKEALENRGDQVMKLFTSSPSPNDIEEYVKTETGKGVSDDELRKKFITLNTGIFKRLEDVINNSVGKSDCAILKKAGFKDTATETTNDFTKQLTKQDKAIAELVKKVAAKQERYYQMFAKLETAMNKLNSQQNWLAQQMGR